MTTPQVLITQSAQAVVQTTAADPAVVEVLAQAVPVAIEVGVPGPQGPVGPVRQPDEVRIDTATAGVIYSGKAINGAAESSLTWTIIRTTYSAAGLRLTRKVATGVTWTGRAGHTYT